MATSTPSAASSSPSPAAPSHTSSQPPSSEVEGLLSRLIHAGMGPISSIAKIIEKLLAINPGQRLYIVEQLFSKILGRETPIDDREVPFERLMNVLAALPREVSDKFTSRLIATFWQDLQHPTRYWPGVPFRSADGSNNSHIYPHMGASNTSYARSVTGSFQQTYSELPDPRALFHDLMERPTSQPFEPHPTGINSLLFCLAGVITHDLFRSDPANPAINLTTHYADLSPVYGVNQAEQNQVRTFQQGSLHPDTFADPRLQFQIPGIVAMVILFSRNHNYIARQLLSDAVNAAENYRFTHINGHDSPELSPQRTDELVFQTARLINCACYANLILHEYLRTILGLSTDTDFTLNPLMSPPAADPSSGNVVSLEFGYIYRWHSALSKEDAQWLDKFQISRRYHELRTRSQGASGQGQDRAAIFADILSDLHYTREEFEQGPVCMGIHRNPESRAFNNVDLINILKGSMESVASRMGAKKVPTELAEVEVQGICGARKVGLCTLNEFRRFFNLKEYRSYEEMLSGPGVAADPDVVKALERHYGPNGIDRVELYPGVVIEGTKTDGLSLPYTTSRAILSDAVNLLRNDRFYTDGLNRHDLTVWGYNYVNDPSNAAITHGSVFRQIVLNALPEWDSVIGDPEFAEKLLQSPFLVPNQES
ncbi:hypothetical protein CPB97_000719 [Podila verticillata]|nr:hypothetical protein CPB97_000719 [Podila verticillata]